MCDETEIPEYSVDYTIRSGDAETGGNASPVVLSGMFIDAAGHHAAELGLSVYDLFPENRTWVLSRFSMIIEQYPKVWDKLKIMTKPTGAKRIFAYRNFTLYDSIGIIIGAASTSWVVIDVKTRRPIHIGRFLEKMGRPFPDCVPDDTPERLRSFEGSDHEQRFNVRHRDIDLNDHVTSTSYVEWALATVPEELRQDLPLASFTINYSSETFLGEEVTSVSAIEQNGSTVTVNHRISSLKDGRELALARSTWHRDMQY